MSQIRIRANTIGLAVLVLASLIGCGDPNANAPFDIDAQKHTGNWIANHAAASTTNIGSCAECHGQDLAGGVSGISCTQCHMGGSYSVHPLDWGEPTALNHSAFVVSQGTNGCANANCHGASLLGGTTGPSCSSCHLGGTMSIHPADWAGTISTAHGAYVNTNTSNSCKNIYCHGANLEGVLNSGPACDACHAMP
jgi:hypothetical protein